MKGSHRSNIVSGFTGIVILAMLTVGCESMQQALSGMSKPSADIAGVRLANLTAQKIDLLFDVDVSNPYQVPLPLTNMTYSLASGGTPFLDGAADVSGTIPAGGSKRLTVPASVTFSKLMTALSGVQPGQVVPYDASLDLSVDAPGVGPLSLPLRKRGEVPVPAVPKVRLAGVDFKELSFNQAAATVNLEVENTNAFNVDLKQLGYDLNLAGSRVATGGVQEAVALKSGQAGSIAIPIQFSPAQFGLAMFNMLRGQGADYAIEGDMQFDTPYGSLSMPYSRSGETNLTR